MDDRSKEYNRSRLLSDQELAAMLVRIRPAEGAGSGCPDLSALALFALGRLPEAEARKIFAHFGSCDGCFFKYQGLVDDPDAAQAALLKVRPPESPKWLQWLRNLRHWPALPALSGSVAVLVLAVSILIQSDRPLSDPGVRGESRSAAILEAEGFTEADLVKVLHLTYALQKAPAPDEAAGAAAANPARRAGYQALRSLAAKERPIDLDLASLLDASPWPEQAEDFYLGQLDYCRAVMCGLAEDLRPPIWEAVKTSPQVVWLATSSSWTDEDKQRFLSLLLEEAVNCPAPSQGRPDGHED